MAHNGGGFMGAGVIGLVLASVLLNTAAQFLLKMGASRLTLSASGFGAIQELMTQALMEPLIWFGACIYAVSFGVWIAALSKAPMSVAYPMLALGYVIGSAAAWMWLGEELPPLRMAGIGLIVIGVCLIAKSA